MEYKILSKMYYQDRNGYEHEYQRRFSSDYAIHLDFEVKEYPAFFIQTPKTISMLTEILKMNHAVSGLCQALPGAAINQFSRRCLVDEIVLTNNIEGVRSTRKEISDILDELETESKGKRFYGLVQKYYMLMTKEELPLNTCEDIRKVYNELVLNEVKMENPENIPDGQLFRKDTVSVYSQSQKEIHRGLYPEKNIIAAMEKALAFLNDDTHENLYRLSIFHYLLEYIHPFYDGNGRLGRFISSYLLSQELEPVTAYRLSYTIKENINEYYQAFSICNDPLNRGDLTPFLEMFLKIIQTSVKKLMQSLEQGFTRLNRNRQRIPELVTDGDEKMMMLYDLLIQAALFSEYGVPTRVVMQYMGVSRSTMNKNIEKIPAQLLKKAKRGNTNYYSIHIDQLEREVADPV